MINFKKWFEDRQQMMFSTGARDVFHGSNTGADNSVLQSFANGVRSNVAQGYGQGAGFYVWSDKQTAAKHAMNIIHDDNMQTQARTDGLPMVVTIQATLTPEEWDLDYEANRNAILKWLHKNWESVKANLGDVLNTQRTRPVNEPAMTTALGTNIPARQGFTFAKAGKNGTKGSIIGGEGDVGEGELLSLIMNHLQKNDPRVIHPFEELFFANLSPQVAIKYVGQKVLPTKQIDVFQNNQWVDAKSLNTNVA